MRVTSVLVCAFLSLAALASAGPDTSVRPVARAEATPVAGPDLSSVRPVARPTVLEPVLVSQLEQQFQRENNPNYRADPVGITFARARAFAGLSPQATDLSLRPFVRPDEVVRKAMAQRRERARGAVCSDPDIQGETVGIVPGRISGCGVQNAVRVRSVSGIALSQKAVMDCSTAKALKRWVNQGMKPAVGSFGGGVRQIKVAAHYACRTRNNQPGARISEHGKGRAIDISGFTLKDGRKITLLQGWGQRTTGAILRDMHRRACGIFGTVLGPESNRWHRDHFHFDTARYRSGSYCR
ncbi:extensin family protein [Marivita sp. S6314]|uniref:extensin-like domain-containing protein n=1 Tax=Marivita sp. S6314 TaxID=2926406 RepID=UPI001FF5ABD6|nr:extensin family protein [Marivita sp. S6314]MCK0151824.1 extensin family protein [Marivita sp. S6314]